MNQEYLPFPYLYFFSVYEVILAQFLQTLLNKTAWMGAALNETNHNLHAYSKMQA